jgi:hypothetical protein
MQAMQMMSMQLQGLGGMTPEAQVAHVQQFLAAQGGAPAGHLQALFGPQAPKGEQSQV